MVAETKIKRTHLLTGAIGVLLISGMIQVGPAIFQDDRSYENLNPDEFQQTVNQPNSFTVDVHIPQSDIHVEGTDAFIPYNELKRIGTYC